jgi:hypothetical protein
MSVGMIAEPNPRAKPLKKDTGSWLFISNCICHYILTEEFIGHQSYSTFLGPMSNGVVGDVSPQRGTMKRRGKRGTIMLVSQRRPGQFGILTSDGKDHIPQFHESKTL